MEPRAVQFLHGRFDLVFAVRYNEENADEETTMGHKEKAMALFREGYNCTQAVVGAFCEELGMDFETAMRCAQSFGGGFARMREVCGAVSGMALCVGFSHGSADPKDKAQKARQYEIVRGLMESYRAQNGSYICRELLGLEGAEASPVPEERTPQYYKKRPCAELVGCAAEILERFYAQQRGE